MLIDIHIKFCEDILNGFQVIEQARFFFVFFFFVDKVPREIIQEV